MDVVTRADGTALCRSYPICAEDRRGLTPLFWAHVASYGEVRLDMGRRLPLHGAAPAAPPETR